jgi:hypothetical protein
MDVLDILRNRIAELGLLVPERERQMEALHAEILKMKEEINGHRHALDLITRQLAQIQAFQPHLEPSTSEPSIPPEAQLHAREAATPKRRAPRKQIKIYTNSYLNGAYKVPGADTNVGLAVHIIREGKEVGVTRPELLQRSREYRPQPLSWESIGSQLHEMIKRGVVRKEGDRYVAN